MIILNVHPHPQLPPPQFPGLDDETRKTSNHICWWNNLSTYAEYLNNILMYIYDFFL